MISFDTNIAVHAANADSPDQAKAADFLTTCAKRPDVVICELMLVELFLKLCNAKIFEYPMTPEEAGAYCLGLRTNRNWRLVESAPIMADAWKWTKKPDFAFRRLLDIRLGLTLRHHGVKEFATTNAKDFQNLGFDKVWNPLEDSVSR
jgi:toxin-antitoxin system PIN domain toxin